MKPSTRFVATPAPSRAGSLDLVGCELALDFCNTSSGRGFPSHQEHLRAFGDVLRWAVHAKVVKAVDGDLIRTLVAEPSERADALLAEVLAARELVWTVATELAERRAVPEEHRQALVALHARCLSHADLEVRDGVYLWSWTPRRDILSALLGPITLSALTLLMERDLTRTKRCEGLECGWMFLDTTKNKTRRWCEMRVCGNRSKVRAARQRQRARGEA
jgi:predicted RNA-binding Zn ribbon-like protein